MTPLPHHAPGGGFRNPWPQAESHGFLALLRWFAQRRTTHRPPPDPPASAFTLANPQVGTALAEREIAVTWIGHSTVLVELPGFRILTDPIWSDYPSPFPARSLRRWVAPPLPLGALPPVDLILVSHNHYDHLDAPTVRELARLQPEATWITPLGVGSLLRRLGAGNTRELDWWDQEGVGQAMVTATPAQHFSSRGLHDRNRTLWAGFAVTLRGRGVFFAGDTGYHPEFGEIAERCGPFDLLLLPVGAYEPRWFMRTVHMNPEDAVLAYRELVRRGGREDPDRLTTLVPIHWGTFKLTDEPMDEPPRRLRSAWVAGGLPPAALALLPHGGTQVLFKQGSDRLLGPLG